jgi:menaquinone-dependent protoporphyrinogen oxidase
MRVAVVYATVEGQTRRIAERVAEHLRGAGHDVTLAEANAEGEAAAALEGAEAAVLAAPIHAGHYPTPFLHVVNAGRERLAAMPTAMVSVTLAIIGDAEERAEAERYVATLGEATGWRPGAVHHAAGALRFAEYDFFKRWIMRLIARQHGYGAGGDDREFTDWDGADRVYRRVRRGGGEAGG